jgi:hypothetical protein
MRWLAVTVAAAAVADYALAAPAMTTSAKSNPYCSQELFLFSAVLPTELAVASNFCNSFIKPTVRTASTTTMSVVIARSTTVGTYVTTSISSSIQTSTAMTVVETDVATETDPYAVTATQLTTLYTVVTTTNIGTTTSTTTTTNPTFTTDVTTTNLGTTTIEQDTETDTATTIVSTQDLGTTSLATSTINQQFTRTFQAHTQIYISATTTVTSTSTAYVFSQGPAKKARAAQTTTISPPQIWSNYLAQALSSACSCVLISSLPSPSTSYTATVTTEVTTTSIYPVTATSVTVLGTVSLSVTYTPTTTLSTTTTSTPSVASTASITVTDDLTSTISSDYPVTTTETSIVTDDDTATISIDYPTTTTFTTSTIEQDTATISSDYGTTTTQILTGTTTSTSTSTQVLTRYTYVTIPALATATISPHAVINGNWETGNTSPWYVDDNPNAGTYLNLAQNPNPSDGHGNYYMVSSYNGANTYNTDLEQDIYMVPGVTYTLSFDYQCVQSGAGYFQNVINGNSAQLFSVNINCGSVGSWQTYSTTITPNSGHNSLWFTFFGLKGVTGNYWYLDNIAVNAVGS